jgi:hypothetical protein
MGSIELILTVHQQVRQGILVFAATGLVPVERRLAS